MIEECKSCHFSKEIITMYCRRYPPVHGVGRDDYPEVLGAMWCGEYKPKEAGQHTMKNQPAYRGEDLEG